MLEKIQPKITVRAHNNTLIPMDDHTAEWIMKQNRRTTIGMSVEWQHRCPMQHRKYMKMLRLAYESMEGTEYTWDSFRKQVLLRSGFFTPTLYDNLLIKIPNSLGFQGIDGREFHELFRRSHSVLIADFGIDLPDFSKDFF